MDSVLMEGIADLCYNLCVPSANEIQSLSTTIDTARWDSESRAREFCVSVEGLCARHPRDVDVVFEYLLILYARYEAVLADTTGVLPQSAK